MGVEEGQEAVRGVYLFIKNLNEIISLRYVIIKIVKTH